MVWFSFLNIFALFSYSSPYPYLLFISFEMSIVFFHVFFSPTLYLVSFSFSLVSIFSSLDPGCRHLTSLILARRLLTISAALTAAAALYLTWMI